MHEDPDRSREPPVTGKPSETERNRELGQLRGRYHDPLYTPLKLLYPRCTGRDKRHDTVHHSLIIHRCSLILDTTTARVAAWGRARRHVTGGTVCSDRLARVLLLLAGRCSNGYGIARIDVEQVDASQRSIDPGVRWPSLYRVIRSGQLGMIFRYFSTSEVFSLSEECLI